MTLKQQATSGARWSGVSQVVRQLALLATTFVLTRLLDPSDFGLLAMATVVTGFVALFKDLGTAAAIIQRRELDDRLLSTIFWANLGVAIGLTSLVILIAPLLALFYREPQVVPVLRALALSFIIASVSVVQQALLERKLRFAALARVEICAVLLGAASGIAAAVLGYGVWSLVMQNWVMLLVLSFGFIATAQWRPGLHFAWADLRAIAGFSSNLVAFNSLNYFARNADYIMIGRVLGSGELGLYTLAYRIMLYPVQHIAAVIGRVTFPVFAQLQDDNARLRVGYLRIISTIALITVPLMLGLMALSDLFVATVFGEAWQRTTILLTILAPVGLVQSIGTTVGAIYQAKGRTDLFLAYGLGASTLTVTAFALGLRWGIEGVAVAYLIATMIILIPSFLIPLRLIELPLSALWSALWRPLAAGLLMLVSLLALRMALPTTLVSLLQLALLVPTGALIYLVASWWLNREQMQQALVLVRGRV
jgi:PST family polysaccharide transporter